MCTFIVVHIICIIIIWYLTMMNMYAMNKTKLINSGDELYKYEINDYNYTRNNSTYYINLQDTMRSYNIRNRNISIKL